ncbi:MAG: 1-deoxy-D-xylulose-5-phosphate reductoisomerase [Deltaproteobacteria bacterium]|nr:1-deoxy-D-xylulose-5-phosphate reductoisomerase [Deltaproteobacteria bacterium]
MKRIVILGSTGSIGTQALDIVRRHPERFQVVGLAAGNNLDLLKAQIQEFKPRRVSVANPQIAQSLQSLFNHLEVMVGEEGHCALVQDPEVDFVVSAIVGAAGLKPTMRALECGKAVGLANKESLVIAGELMTRKAKESKAALIPIDSEHSAIFQTLVGNRKADLKRIILTASGGPFFELPKARFDMITVEEALKHPRWSMGPKITVDSATLMNKGLEVIEASWFFDTPADRVAIHVHPQSIVHSMVEYIDGSVLAQMGVPDMRCAISYAMAYPERVTSGVKSLDLLEARTLTFFPPDPEKFPCLRLAYEAAKVGQTMPAVLNAANEVAVARFLNRDISFIKIPQIVERTMQRHRPSPLTELTGVFEADRWAREEAAK